jgi:hypothetical protein
MNEIMDVLGGTFGGTVAKNAETAAGRMEILKNSIAETKESIGAALLPALEKVLPQLHGLAMWAQDNPDLFVKVGGAIAGIAAAIFLVNAAMATNPFVLATAGVIGLALAFNKLVDAASEINKIGGLAAKLLGLVISPATALTGNILRGLPDLGSLMPSTPMPAPSMPNIPRMAEGGIVSSPTLALIGEAGPEAVVPLDRMNTGGGVTVNVTGGLSTSAEIGQAVVNALRAYSRSAGPLALNIV